MIIESKCTFLFLPADHHVDEWDPANSVPDRGGVPAQVTTWPQDWPQLHPATSLWGPQLTPWFRFVSRDYIDYFKMRCRPCSQPSVSFIIGVLTSGCMTRPVGQGSQAPCNTHQSLVHSSFTIPFYPSLNASFCPCFPWSCTFRKNRYYHNVSQELSALSQCATGYWSRKLLCKLWRTFCSLSSCSQDLYMYIKVM